MQLALNTLARLQMRSSLSTWLLLTVREEKKEDDSSKQKNCKPFVQSANTTSAKSLLPAVKKMKPDVYMSDEDYGVIVCESESRTKVVHEVAKELGFSHYVFQAGLC